MSNTRDPGSAETQTLAKATGDLPSTWERRARALRAKGMLETQIPGRRRKDDKPRHAPASLMNLILSPAGEPIEAATTAATLSAVRYVRTIEFRTNRAQDASKAATFSRTVDLGYGRKGKNLGDLGAQLIESYAQMPAADRWELRMAIRAEGAKFRFCLNPVFAELSWSTFDDLGELHRVDRYEPQPEQCSLPLEQAKTAALVKALQAPIAPTSQETLISFDLLFVAADLLAETLAQRDDLFPSDENATRPKRKAPAPRHREPAPLRDRSTREALSKPEQLEVKAPHSHTQVFERLRADHSTPSVREESSYDGPQALDAAAA